VSECLGNDSGNCGHDQHPRRYAFRDDAVRADFRSFAHGYASKDASAYEYNDMIAKAKDVRIPAGSHCYLMVDRAIRADLHRAADKDIVWVNHEEPGPYPRSSGQLDMKEEMERLLEYPGKEDKQLPQDRYAKAMGRGAGPIRRAYPEAETTPPSAVRSVSLGIPAQVLEHTRLHPSNRGRSPL
jgi:hypothetical protein